MVCFYKYKRGFTGKLRGKTCNERKREMFAKVDLKRIMFAGLFFTILSVSYIIVPDNANYDSKRKNVDCTGLIASNYGQYIR